jgi:hypothetical protein
VLGIYAIHATRKINLYSILMRGFFLNSLDYSLVAETPEMYSRQSVADFITQEVACPNKQWVAAILDGIKEQGDVILRTGEFVLLPDTERPNRYSLGENIAQPMLERRGARVGLALNWLAIVQDKSIRTLRDLHEGHIPMLKRMLDTCMQTIGKEAGIPCDQVLAYIHYPPSVYQLHVHFAYPYSQYFHRDALRVHSLQSVITNLEMDADYYRKVTLYMAIQKQSLHYEALTGGSPVRNEGAGADIKEASLNGKEVGVLPFRSRCQQLQQPWCPSRVWSTLAA